MDNKKNNELRGKALELIKKRGIKRDEFYHQNLEKLIEELNIYQIELEHQNDELVCTQEDLENSKNNFRSLFDHAPVAYFIINKEHIIIDINQVALNFLNKEKHEIVNTRFTQFILKEFQDAFYFHFRKVFNDETDDECDVGVQCTVKDKICYLHLKSLVKKSEIDGSKLMRIAAIDISKRVEFEKQNSFQINILKNIKDSVIVTNLKGEVTYWNNGAQKIFGYSEHEMIGGSVAKIYPDLNEFELAKDLEKIIEGHDYKGEWKGRTKQGDTVWIDIRTTVLRDNKGKVSGFIGISQDITEKKKALRYKNELFNIVEHSNDGIESMDLDGNILSWNKGAEKIYGYKAQEMIGKNALLLYPDDLKEELKAILIKIKEGRFVDSIDTKRKNKNGQSIDVNINFSPLKDEEDNLYGISVITRDVTELKKVSKKLSLSEYKYQSIFENSGEGLLLMDDKFIDCNKKLCDLWGYSKDKIIGKTPGFFSPKHQPDGSLSETKAKKYVDLAYKDGSISFYWQYVTKTKKKLDTRITLNKIIVDGDLQLIAVVQDLSELFKYQNKLKAKTKELAAQNEEINFLNEELRETNNRLSIINSQIEQSEKKFRAAFKVSPDAITISTLKDGRYIEVNDGFVSTTGYKEREVINKTSSDLKLWSDQGDRDRFIAELKDLGKILNFEIKFRVKNGTIITCLTSASIINLAGEDHIISITRDISERKEYEIQLKEATKKAEESDMLKSAFLANMSHEIRTPMNAILGFSQLLKEKELEREKQNKFLDIIVSRSKNLLQIINDIIDISKIEANQLKIEIQEFSLKRTLYEIQSFFEAEIYAQGKENLKLDFTSTLSDEASIIRSDEIRLKQILINLISNSIKFTEQGKIEFGYHQKNNYLEFFVCDTGVGIPKVAHNRIFERFRQADDSSTREYGGTGLGLSISKQLVEKLGGKIWFESEVNKGSKFFFTIPFVPVKEMKMKNEPKSSDILDLSGKKVLVVEDDLISMTYLKEILLLTKANVLTATDGKKAIDIFKNNTDIDIVLMDVYLPILSGNEAVKEIKKIDSTVPIIMQSAYAMPADKKESFKHGCDDYITKPIDTRVLMYTIKKYLR